MPFLNKDLKAPMILTIGARNSPLSLAQVREILLKIRTEYPYINFDPLYISVKGDKDLQTSLRSLDKSDFFTKEIDELVLSGRCRIGIHSAKDLPSPLPKGLTLVRLTPSIDPSDSLVLREGLTLKNLPKGAIIATSSIRREKIVEELGVDVRFIDLRGTIHQRLEKLNTGDADGVVVAEAALIRLGLTHLNRFKLPGSTVEGQGQLAVTAMESDREMRELFAFMSILPSPAWN